MLQHPRSRGANSKAHETSLLIGPTQLNVYLMEHEERQGHHTSLSQKAWKPDIAFLYYCGASLTGSQDISSCLVWNIPAPLPSSQDNMKTYACGYSICYLLCQWSPERLEGDKTGEKEVKPCKSTSPPRAYGWQGPEWQANVEDSEFHYPLVHEVRHSEIYMLYGFRVAVEGSLCLLKMNTLFW